MKHWSASICNDGRSLARKVEQKYVLLVLRQADWLCWSLGAMLRHAVHGFFLFVVVAGLPELHKILLAHLRSREKKQKAPPKPNLDPKGLSLEELEHTLLMSSRFVKVPALPPNPL